MVDLEEVKKVKKKIVKAIAEVNTGGSEADKRLAIATGEAVLVILEALSD